MTYNKTPQSLHRAEYLLVQLQRENHQADLDELIAKFFACRFIFIRCLFKRAEDFLQKTCSKIFHSHHDFSGELQRTTFLVCARARFGPTVHTLVRVTLACRVQDDDQVFVQVDIAIILMTTVHMTRAMTFEQVFCALEMTLSQTQVHGHRNRGPFAIAAVELRTDPEVLYVMYTALLCHELRHTLQEFNTDELLEANKNLHAIDTNTVSGSQINREQTKTKHTACVAERVATVIAL